MAVDVVWCLIYLAVVVLIGFAATSAILGKDRRLTVEIAGLTLLLGVGVTGSLLILLSIIGIPPTRWVILLLGAASIGAIVSLWRLGRVALPAPPKFDEPAWIELLLLLLPIVVLLGVIIAGAIPAVSFDYFEWDSAVIWGFKAKVLYEQALLWHSPQYFHDVRFSYSHLDYPLLWPMTIAGAYGAMGHPSERLGKVIVPLIVAGQSLLAYSGARLWLGRPASLLLAIMLVGLPVAITNIGIGSTDALLTAFYLGAIVYLIRWIMQRKRSDIILAAVFSGFVASTKSEGLPLALINLVVVLAVGVLSRPKRSWTDLGVFASIILGFVGFWIVWRIGIPHTHDDYASRMTPSIVAENIGRIGTIAGRWKTDFLSTYGFGWFWIVVPIMAILGFRAFATREAQALWALLVLHLLLYMLVYVITDWDVKELLGVTSQRLLLHVTPIAMLLIAVHWSATKNILPDSE